MFVAIVKSSKFNSLAQNHKYASKGFTIFTAYGTNHMLRPSVWIRKNSPFPEKKRKKPFTREKGGNVKSLSFQECESVPDGIYEETTE